MKLSRLIFSSLGLAFAAGAFAQTTSASGLITLTGQSGGLYTYDIDLTNTGSTSLQTFWFSWVPGLNFMPDQPSNITAPTNWTENITSGGGYAIQFVTNGGLAGGNSLNGFTFSSPDSPSVLMGTQTDFGVPYPILTSTVYVGQPFDGASDQFVVAFSSTPEPASWLAFSGLGLVTLAGRRKRLRSSR